VELEIEARGRRWLGGGLALLVLAGGVLSAYLLLNPGSGSIASRTNPSTALRPHVTARIAVGYMPGSVATAAGSVWAAVFNRSPKPYQGQLVRVDPRTNQVTARIPLTTPPDAIVGGAGTVWADGSPWPFRILRIDPASNQIATRIVGGAGLVTYGAGSVWALGHQTAQESVVRIDVETNRIVATIPLPPFVTDMTFGDGRLWVLADHYSHGRNNGHVLEIDPRTNTVVRRTPVQNGGPSISAGGGAVWVQGWRSIVRLDGRTGKRTRISLRSPSFRPFAYGKGGVWFIGAAAPWKGSAICRLNAATLRVDSCVDPGPIGDLESAHPVFALDRRTGTIWVSNFRHTITRIDLR
jgi:hypothetical protein